MVWACIMNGNKGPLIALEYISGRKRRRDELKMIPRTGVKWCFVEYWGQKCCERGEVVFQQDGASSHTSKSKKWFFYHHFLPFPHLTSSLDINPIEPVWHELKKCMHTLQHFPTTVDELINIVTKIWDELPLEDIDKHVNGCQTKFKQFWMQKVDTLVTNICI
jgi:hypothetical protein